MKARTLGLIVATVTVVLFLPLCVTSDVQPNISQHKDNQDAQVDPVVEETAPSIVMLSRDGCPPCDRWEAECAAELRASGWLVAVDKNNFKGSTPTFVVTIGGEKFYKTGYSSKAKFYQWLRSIIDTKPKADKTESKPSAKSCKPRKRTFGRPNLLRRRK